MSELPDYDGDVVGHLRSFGRCAIDSGCGASVNVIRGGPSPKARLTLRTPRSEIEPPRRRLKEMTAFIALISLSVVFAVGEVLLILRVGNG